VLASAALYPPSSFAAPHLGLRQVARITAGNDAPARRLERIKLDALNLDGIAGACGLARDSLCPVPQQRLGETLGAGFGGELILCRGTRRCI
jgi:hypothetical protein